MEPKQIPNELKKFVTVAEDKARLELALEEEGIKLVLMEEEMEKAINENTGKPFHGQRGWYELMDQRVHHQKEIVNFLAQQIFVDYYWDGILTNQKYKK